MQHHGEVIFRVPIGGVMGAAILGRLSRPRALIQINAVGAQGRIMSRCEGRSDLHAENRFSPCRRRVPVRNLGPRERRVRGPG